MMFKKLKILTLISATMFTVGWTKEDSNNYHYTSQYTLVKNETEEVDVNDEIVEPEYEYIEFKLTYYTDMPSENGGYTVTCTGKELEVGMVANNYLSIGTEIYLEDYGTVVVEDRGGSNFNVENRLDVFVPRNSGESDEEYLSRVNNMGIDYISGYIIK